MIIMAVLLLGGAALAWFGVNLLTERAMGRPGEVTADLLPASTQAYFTLNLRPGSSQINKAKRLFSIFEDTSGFTEQRDDLADDLDDETGIDPMEGISSWLGKDITFAVLDSPPGSAPQWVVLLQTRDREASEEFLDDLSNYLEGSQLLRFHGDDRQSSTVSREEKGGAAFGVTDRYVLIGSSRAVVETTAGHLETPPANSLSEDESFLQVSRQLPSERFMLTFVRSGTLQRTWREVDFQGLGVPDNYLPEVVGLSGSFIGEGIRFDLHFETPGVEVLQAEVTPLNLSGFLPADPLLMISGNGFARIWQRFRETLKARHDYRSDRIDQVINALEDEIGVNLEQEIFGELVGGMAVAVVPGGAGSKESWPYVGTSAVEALALAEVADTAGFKIALENLTSYLEEIQGLRVRRTQVGRYEAVTLDLGNEEGEAIHYTPWYLLTEDMVVLGTTGGTLSRFAGILDGNESPLTSNPRYIRLSGLMPDQEPWVLFGDTAGIIEIGLDFLSPGTRSSYNERFRSLLKPFRELFAVAAFSSESTKVTLILTVGGHEMSLAYVSPWAKANALLQGIAATIMPDGTD